MGDIVERLREECESLKVDVQVVREAADEIERLRRALLIAAGKLSATDAYAMLPPDVVYGALLILADKEAT